MEYKGYKLEYGVGMMVEIKAIGKGSVVLALRGMYTSRGEAVKAIDTFLNKKESKGGRSKSSG